MQRKTTAALGAALTTLTPAGVALASQPGPDTGSAKAETIPVRTQVHGPGSIESRMAKSGRRIVAHRHLVTRNVKLATKAHDLSDRAARRHARRARRWSSGRLRRENRGLERELKHAATGASTSGVAGGTLAAIRSCESGGNYSTNTGNGFYGAYQFTQSTWEGVGGSGSPASASPAEQDRRAAILYSRSGAGQWPVCGR
jgi:Transglycosylase-like domain